MNITNSKKYAMGIAALLILIFHIWIPVFRYGTNLGQIERFIIGASYIGVDIFFFVSAYVLTLRPINNIEAYGKFLLNRIAKMVPLFIVAYLTGQFLWFIPALLTTYILFTPIFKVSKKSPGISFFLLLLCWAAITTILLEYINESQNLGIYLFRIPIILLGSYLASFDGKMSKGLKLSLGVLLTIIGIYITINYGYMNKLDVPYKDTFYLTGIPLTIGVLLLIDSASEYIQILPLKFLGNISLELYFTQVVFGTFFVETFYGILNNKVLTNFATIAISILISAMLGFLWKLLSKKQESIKQKRAQ